MATLHLNSRITKSAQPVAPVAVPDESFYIVWNPGRCRPRVRHASLDLARAEAARLQSLHPDESFWIYETRRVSP